MANQIPRIIKFVIRYAQCPKMAIPYKDEKIVITQKEPYLIFDIPENKEKIRFLSTHRMIGRFDQMHVDELIAYFTNPKNLPEIEKVMHRNDEIVKINKYKPEDEEEIILNLKKRGYQFIAPADGSSMIYGIKEAIDMLQMNGYQVTKVKDKVIDTERTQGAVVNPEVDSADNMKSLDELKHMNYLKLKSYLSSKGCKIEKTTTKEAMMSMAKELMFKNEPVVPDPNTTKEDIVKVLNDSDKVLNSYAKGNNGNS